MQEFTHELKTEYLRRKQRNSVYSLRAFAASLEIDQSLLSKILQGKRRPSKQFIVKAGQAMGLHPKKIKQFIGDPLEPARQDYRRLEYEHLLSNWLHFAILELMKTQNFQSDTHWIARRLNVTELETEDAVERLSQLGYLDTSQIPWHIRSVNQTWTDTESTSMVRRRLQKRLLEKAQDAVDECEFNRRENASLTIQCSPELLPEIKKKMARFRAELDRFIEDRGPHSEVYQLVMGFFPLTQTKVESK